MTEMKAGGFMISTDKSKLQIDVVIALIKSAYWAADRSSIIIEKSIENSLCYGVYEDDKQIGFARVITDYATYAYICDLIIAEGFRGAGLGKWLMECIMQDKSTELVKKWRLVTADAHRLYEQYGFSNILDTYKHMELIRE